MAQHRAALAGVPDSMFDGSTAELATALLQRLGALAIPQSGGSRHRAVLYSPPTTAAPTASPSAALAATLSALSTARSHLPTRPVLAAMSVTAVGAAAAITATGAFAVHAPATAALSLSPASSSTVTDSHTGHGPAVGVAPAVPAVPALPASAAAAAAGLPTVQVDKIVGQAVKEAQDVTARQAAATAAAAKAAPVHVPVPLPPTAAGPAAHATGGSAVALAAAMTAMGKPYRWGATGPSAFDCSGLVQWSFAKAGIKLPRTAAAQSTVGTPVSRSQLQPGDLVFFYSPVSHVGIYVGNGKVINATQTGEPVQLSNIAYMPIHNIRRV